MICVFALLSVLFKDVVGGVFVDPCGMEIDPDFNVEMEKVVNDWNSFEMVGNKPFSLQVVSCEPYERSHKKYRIGQSKKPQYACHCGDKVTAEVKENYLLNSQTGRRAMHLFYRVPETSQLPRFYMHNENYTREELRKSRADAGLQTTQAVMAVLEREAQWNAEWRARPVMLALFVFFKGQLLDTRKSIYMLLREEWLAEAH